ncbi:hypothetical protein HALDL1_12505 [Halobacterium sp. DL1]|jgi:hypothetical protein|nr:hypothetical protein HALDL1_12505 [Halobacterium sp. DL1]
MTADEGVRVDHAALAAVDVDTDDLMDVLSNPRRRFVVACLAEYDTPLTLPDVADELAVWEHDARITEISAEDVAAIHTDLYHVHVPKMADAGVVEYSQERELVALAEPSRELATRLELPSIR